MLSAFPVRNLRAHSFQCCLRPLTHARFRRLEWALWSRHFEFATVIQNQKWEDWPLPLGSQEPASGRRLNPPRPPHRRRMHQSPAFLGQGLVFRLRVRFGLFREEVVTACSPAQAIVDWLRWCSRKCCPMYWMARFEGLENLARSRKSAIASRQAQ